MSDFNLDDGLMLFDKWKASPNADGSERLDNWVWDNIGMVFKLLGEIQSLRKFADRCRHYEHQEHAACQSSLETLKQIAVLAKSSMTPGGALECGRIASKYLNTVLCNRCGAYLDGFGNCSSCRNDAWEEFQAQHQ